MSRVLRLGALGALAVLSAPVAWAQTGQREPAARLDQPRAAGRPGAAGGRAPLEQLAALVQRRLRLTDDQSARLRRTTGGFAAKRQELVRQERETRRALRAQMEAGDAADQQIVAGRLDELLRLQQRRTEIVAEEQRDLAVFLTPVQRAQFLAMQERAFRAAQQLQKRRTGAGADPESRP